MNTLNREQLKTDYASRAYKKTHGTFANYCRSVHGISRCYAYNIVKGWRSKKRHISDRLRWEIWERDNFTCVYCGTRKFLSIDHIIPESRGGTEDPTNLQTACITCNKKRQNKPLEEEFSAAWKMFTSIFVD